MTTTTRLILAGTSATLLALVVVMLVVFVAVAALTLPALDRGGARIGIAQGAPGAVEPDVTPRPAGVTRPAEGGGEALLDPAGFPIAGPTQEWQVGGDHPIVAGMAPAVPQPDVGYSIEQFVRDEQALQAVRRERRSERASTPEAPPLDPTRWGYADEDEMRADLLEQLGLPADKDLEIRSTIREDGVIGFSVGGTVEQG